MKNYLYGFKNEKNYKLKEVSIILIIALIFIIIFDSSGLLSWAKKLKVGKTRNTFMTIFEPLNLTMSSFKLNYPRIFLKTSFTKLMGKEREAGWIAAENQSGTENFTIPQNTGNSVINPVNPDATEVRNNTVFTTASPLNVLLIGDSMMGDGFGTMILRSLNDFGPTERERSFKVSSGLSRPDFYNWPAQIRQIFSQDNYDAIVIMMGTNDAQNFEMDGVIYQYGSDEWFEVYESRLNSFLDTLCTYTQQVYWVGMPPMRSSGYNSRMESLNEVFEKGCLNHQYATFVSTVPIMGDRNGNYTTYLTVNGREIKIRDDRDGIHMTRAGGQLIADKIMELLKEDFNFDE